MWLPHHLTIQRLAGNLRRHTFSPFDGIHAHSVEALPIAYQFADLQFGPAKRNSRAALTDISSQFVPSLHGQHRHTAEQPYAILIRQLGLLATKHDRATLDHAFAIFFTA